MGSGRHHTRGVIACAVALLIVALAPGAAVAKKKKFTASFKLHTEVAVTVSGGGNPEIQSSSGSAHTTLDASWKTRALVYRVRGYGKVIDFGKKLKPQNQPKEFATAVPVAASPGSGAATFSSSGSYSGTWGQPPFTEPFTCSYDVGSAPAYAKVLSVHYIATDNPSENKAQLALGDVFGQSTYSYDVTSERCSDVALVNGILKPNGIFFGIYPHAIFERGALLKARKQPGNPGQTVHEHDSGPCFNAAPVQEDICTIKSMDTTATARLLKRKKH